MQSDTVFHALSVRKSNTSHNPPHLVVKGTLRRGTLETNQELQYFDIHMKTAKFRIDSIEPGTRFTVLKLSPISENNGEVTSGSYLYA